MKSFNPHSLLPPLRSISVVATCLIAVATTTRADQVITLVGDPWPPYVEGELGQDAQSGRGVELVKRIFERIEGVDVRFPLIPWNRALRAVEEGSHDGIVMLLKTPERERFMAYTEPLFASDSLVWYSETRFPNGYSWRDIGDFEGHAVGINRGYSYGYEIDAAIADGELTVTQVPTVDRLFAMLARGRVELVVANDYVGYALASQHVDARIRPAEKPTGTDVYHIGLSRKSAAVELLPRINGILIELRREGIVDALMQPR